MHRIRVPGHLGVNSRRPGHPALTSSWTECEKCPKMRQKCPSHHRSKKLGLPPIEGNKHSIVASTASPAKPALHMHLPFSTTSVATYWPVIITVLLVMPTMMLSIMSLTTTEGSTARSASSQAEPAISMQLCRSETVLLVHTHHAAEKRGRPDNKREYSVKCKHCHAAAAVEGNTARGAS